MKVTFTRTAERRYRVSVEGPGVVSSFMEPAPGYNARLPHDMAHFVVENELGITGGVFGQLAAGGDARTFHPLDEEKRRKVARRGKRMATANRDDAALSEKLVYIAWQTWNNDSTQSRDKSNGQAEENGKGQAGQKTPTRKQACPLVADVTVDDIKRVCSEFDAVSAVWSKLSIGESMTLVWRGNGRSPRR